MKDGPAKDEGAINRLLGCLAWASVGKSTHKQHQSCWQAWKKARLESGKEPLLLGSKGAGDAVKALVEFMTMRCFVHRNQSQTVRGCMAAIKYFHNMYAEWDLPTTHFMVVAVGKGIDRAHAKSELKSMVRKPLSWKIMRSENRRL